MGMPCGVVNNQQPWRLLLAVLLMTALCCCNAQQQPQVPCYFIFGDSLVDNGNNNRLSSLARADYLPYGIDFPRGPTGRFSNGKTTVDVIGKYITFHFTSLTVYVYDHCLWTAPILLVKEMVATQLPTKF